MPTRRPLVPVVRPSLPGPKSEPARPRVADAVRLIAHVRHELGLVFSRAEMRGIVLPTAYVVRTTSFIGLAFARELFPDEKRLRARLGTSSLLIGCDSRSRIACALLAVERDASRRLLEMSIEPEYERRVVVVDRVCRVGALAREAMVLRELPARAAS